MAKDINWNFLEYNRKRRARIKTLGLCVRCMKRKALPKSSTCLRCKEYNLKYRRDPKSKILAALRKLARSGQIDKLTGYSGLIFNKKEDFYYTKKEVVIEAIKIINDIYQ